MRRVLLATALLFAALPVEGQTSARARASITIGEVMSLQVRPAGGVAVLAADGVYRELEGAVTLSVLSNRPWQLSVVAEETGARVAGAGHAGRPARALWWRVDGGSAEAFTPAEGWPVEVMSGGAGRTELTLDYRWFDGPGLEAQPGTVLHFALSAR